MNCDVTIRCLSEQCHCSETHLKLYAAFKKIKNVITVVVQKKKLVINLPLDIATVTFEEGFSRDVSGLGHWGCGAVELHLQNSTDLEKAKILIDRAYKGSIMVSFGITVPVFSHNLQLKGILFPLLAQFVQHFPLSLDIRFMFAFAVDKGDPICFM